MKKLFIVALILLISVLSACRKENLNAEDDKSSKEVEWIADYLEITNEKDKEFIVLRVKDDYIEISRKYDWVYVGQGGKYPELLDGQVARVNADVDIYDGGVAGYTGNIFITDLKQYEVLNYRDVADEMDVPSCESSSFANRQRLLQYQDSDKCYFIVLNRNYIRVYLDGTFIKEYEYDGLADVLEPFWIEVVGKEGEI